MSNRKRALRRKLEREQLAIERRLQAAVAPNLSGPLLQGAPSATSGPSATGGSPMVASG